MRTTIDGAGRIVIPKSIRDAMRLGTGGTVDIVFTDGKIEIEAAPIEVDIVDQSGTPRATARGEVPPLSDDAVRETLESTRR